MDSSRRSASHITSIRRLNEETIERQEDLKIVRIPNEFRTLLEQRRDSNLDLKRMITHCTFLCSNIIIERTSWTFFLG